MRIIVKFVLSLICLLMLEGCIPDTELALLVTQDTNRSAEALERQRSVGLSDVNWPRHQNQDRQSRFRPETISHRTGKTVEGMGGQSHVSRMGMGSASSFLAVLLFFIVIFMGIYLLASNAESRYGLTPRKIDDLACELRTPSPLMECFYKYIARKLVPPEKSQLVLVGLADGYQALKTSLETDVVSTSAVKLIRRNALKSLNMGQVGRTLKLLKAQQGALSGMKKQYGGHRVDGGSKHVALEAMALAEIGHVAYFKLGYRRAAGYYHTAAWKIGATEHPDKLELRARYLVLMAIAHHANRKLDKCEQAVNAALTSWAMDLTPDNPVYKRLIIVGKRCIMLSDIDGALSVLDPIITHLMSADDGRRAAWLEFYLELADAYDACNCEGTSDRLRLRAIEILEPLGKDVEHLLFRTLFELAHCCMMECRWDDALKYYSELRERLQDSPEEKAFFRKPWRTTSRRQPSVKMRRRNLMKKVTRSRMSPARSRRKRIRPMGFREQIRQGRRGKKIK